MTTNANPNHTIAFYTQSLKKSPIKNHAILFGLGRVVELDQTKIDSTKPNNEWIELLLAFLPF